MLTHFRNAALLEIPLCLKDLKSVDFTFHEKCTTSLEITQAFSSINYDDILMLVNKTATNQVKLTVGVVLSGGPAPGGHNVILGLYEALKEMDQHNELIGFKDGFDGFLNSKKIEINQTILYQHRNVGGFYLTGSSRKKIQTKEDFEQAKQQALKHHLDALVVIGGDDSNTNAAILADYFIKEKVDCKVIGVPKTIDGDLRHKFLEISFGFDTASKIYSEEIGNILSDAKSAKKYYHFIKLMGRSASWKF